MAGATNDTTGWGLVHDQVRGTIAEAVDRVRVAHPADVRAVRRLNAWWRSFSRSFTHHMHTEDARIWPSLRSVDPAAAAGLSALSAEHQAIEQLLRQVDAAFAALPAPDAAVAAATLLDRLEGLRDAVERHLDAEEASAFPIGRDRVDAGEWAQIERDMVKGLSLWDVSTLLPRILQHAEADDRAMMLRRLPPPVRVIGEHVFVPRYRRLQSQLPGGPR